MFLIIGGHPATGKTTLTEKLKELYPDHTIFHTDDYMVHGYKESVYKLIDDIQFHFSGGDRNIIVEGIMGSRLMRKLQEIAFDEYVDLYVYLRAHSDFIKETYMRERPGKNFKDIEATMKGLDTVHDSIKHGSPEKPGTSILVIHIGDYGDYLLLALRDHLPK